MSKVKVLIVDDSATIRRIIKKTLETDPDIEVVGEADDGKKAIELVAQLKPDIVTMDIHMPIMNGTEAIERIMEEYAVPIVVISGMGESIKAFELIEKGALDLIAKENIDFNNPDEFNRKIKLYSRVKVIGRFKSKKTPEEVNEEKRKNDFDKVVVIASSTGGPKALSTIFSNLKSPFPFPILVAQHIENGFVNGLVEWINNTTPLNVVKAEDGKRIAAGTIYISPSEKNMIVSSGNRVFLNEKEPQDIYSPSCNKLMLSAAKAYGDSVIGVILTGMGDDGAKGMQEIKKQGGKTIAQDESTCIVFGMPNVAIKYGCIDHVMPVDAIAGMLNKLAKDSSQ
ncbi:MAG: chemotaxis-specific protein-glutamate methyltransferase CheB [Nitrospinae bacterium]|nr:chemotaxis-specific protein-glutamate methyltransferase CheB [Nitrospinota bacterium]